MRNPGNEEARILVERMKWVRVATLRGNLLLLVILSTFAALYASPTDSGLPMMDPCDPTASGNVDSDGDGVSDVCDLDDDNDGIPDSAEGVDCTGPIADVVAANIVNNTPFILGQMHDGASVDDTGPEFNTNGHYVIIDLGQVVSAGSSVRFDLWQFNTTPNIRDFRFAQLPSSTPDLGGGTNAVMDTNPGSVTWVLNYVLDADVRYIQVEMTRRLAGRSEITEATLELCSIDLDSDGDGIPDRLDLDSDNDACPDAVEGAGGYEYSQLGANGSLDLGLPSAGIDADGIPYNGASQAIGSSRNPAAVSCCNASVSGYPDNDGDGVADQCDLDQDNDGMLDFHEGHLRANLIPVSPISATAAAWTDMDIAMTAGRYYQFSAIGSSFGLLPVTGGPHNGQTLYLMQYDPSARTDLDGNRYSATGNYWNTPAPPINITWANLTSSDYANELRLLGLIDVNGNGNFDNGIDQLIDPLMQVNGVIEIQASVSGDFYAIYADAGVNVGNAGELTFGVYEFSLRDTDNDGVPDHLDLDSDNDGIYDAVEAGHGQAHTDGALNGPVGVFGIPSSVSLNAGIAAVNYTVLDTDGDGDVDAFDTDADNDFCNDVLEAGFLDENSDGVLGDAPVTVDGNGLVTSGTDGYTGTTAFVTNTAQQSGCPDNDNDLISDHNDLDDDNDGILDDAENQCVIFESFEGISVSGATAPDFYLSDYYQNNPLPANLLPIRSPDYAVNGNVPPASNWFAPIEGGGFLALQANSNANEIGFSATNPQLVANDGIYINYSAEELQLLGVNIGDTVKFSFFVAPGHNWDTEFSLTDPTLRNSDDDTRLKLWYGSSGGGFSFPLPDNPATTLSMSPVQEVVPGAWNPVSSAGDDVMDGGSWLKVEDDFLYEGGELIFAMLAGKGPTNATGESETLFLDDFRICVLVDTDKDDMLNQLDLDSDNDGIYDAVEAGHAQSHTNGVLNGGVDVFGIPLSVSTGSGGVNYTFSDSDNDGNLDANESDSDDDGCTDVLEAGFTDDNLDGVLGDNPVNVDSDGLVTSGTDGYTGTTAFVINADQQSGCPDNDGDLVSDLNDLDDDNDGLLDSEECSLNFVNISSTDLGLGWGEIDAMVTNADVSSVLGLQSGSVLISAEHVYTQSSGIALLQTASDYEPNIPKFTVSGTVPVYVRIRHGQQIPAPGEEDGFTSLDGVPFTFDGSLNPGFTLTSVGSDYYVKRTTGGINAGTIQWTSNGENVGSFEVWTTYSAISPSNYFIEIAVCADTDWDGISNKLDLDSDNDGIHDVIEAGHGESDTDQDGVIDGPASDFGVNGLFNGLETAVDNGVLNYTVSDTDGDGFIDAFESDSDNDGCVDVLEAGFADGDGDGQLGPSPVTVDTDGLVTSGTTGYTGTTAFVTNAAQQSGCPDNDNDLVSDQNDLDDDNDGMPDTYECGLPSNPSLVNGSLTTSTSTLIEADLTSSDGHDFDLAIQATDPQSSGYAGFSNFSSTGGISFRIGTTGVGATSLGSHSYDFDAEFSPTTNPIDQIGFGPNYPTDNSPGFVHQTLTITIASPGPNLTYSIGDPDGQIAGFNDGDIGNLPLSFDVISLPSIDDATWFILIDGAENNGLSPTILDVDVDANGSNLVGVEYYSFGFTSALDFSACPDTDGDGVLDYLDLDSDNDGIHDVLEAGHGELDTDLDGRIDGAVSDFGFNGLFDALETSADNGVLNYSISDSDGDGINDATDTDADNDGCDDVLEAGFADGDGDGQLGTNPVTVDTDGLVTSGTTGYTGTTAFVTNAAQQSGCPDRDNDLISDDFDLDDDNDGIPDSEECNGSFLLDGAQSAGTFTSTELQSTASGNSYSIELRNGVTFNSATGPALSNLSGGYPAPFNGSQTHLYTEINTDKNVGDHGTLTIQFPGPVQDPTIAFGGLATHTTSPNWSLMLVSRNPATVLSALYSDPDTYLSGDTIKAEQTSSYNGNILVQFAGNVEKLVFELRHYSSTGTDGPVRWTMNVGYTPCSDADTDGVVDQFDLDSDNDGIYDVWEAGHGHPQTNGRVNGGVDSFGIPLLVSDGAGGVNYTYADSDSNGTLDAYSIDADGDGCFDVIEAGYIDANNDGVLGTTPVNVDPNGLVIQ